MTDGNDGNVGVDRRTVLAAAAAALALPRADAAVSPPGLTMLAYEMGPGVEQVEVGERVGKVVITVP